MSKFRIFKLFLFLMAVVTSLGIRDVSIAAAPIRQSEVTSPSSGNILVGVDGIYSEPDRQAILNRVNAIRKEAYDAGYVDKYVPIKWSKALEIAARTRAAEAVITLDHTRLTTKSIYTTIPFYAVIIGENLAWNYTKGGQSFLSAIEQWYGEKTDYLKKRTGQAHGVTGHYESLINPNFTYMGLGAFDIDPNKWTGVAQLFATPSAVLDESGETLTGSVTQVLEATMGDISNLKMHGLPTTLTSPVTLSLTGTLTSSRADQAWIQAYRRWVYPTLEVSIRSGIVWTSSQSSVARIDADGVLTPVGLGKTIITAAVGNQQVSREVTIKGISNLETGFTRSIKSGDSVSLPQTVQATWTDGSKTQEPVTWSSADLTNLTTSSKTVTVTGRVNGTNLTTQARVTVHGIQSLANVNRSVKSGQSPQLPTTVQATWTDGTTSQEVVTWSSISTTNTSNRAITVTARGRVNRTNLTATATITVHGIRKFEDVSVNTKSGTAPNLPATIGATWTDGSMTTETIAWDIAPSSYTASRPTTFTVSGRTTKSQSVVARATVHVVTIQEIPAVAVGTYSGLVPSLPNLIPVVWSDGSRSSQAVTWSSLSASQYRVDEQTTLTVRGRVAGTNISAQAHVRIEAIASVAPVYVTTTADTAPVLPNSVQVTWTNGVTGIESVTWQPILASLYQNQVVNSQFTIRGQLTRTSLPAIAQVQVIAQTIPLYRLYHPGLRVHLYTKDLNEYSILGERGWNQEGLAWHVAAAHGDKVYRLYHPGLRVHLYTRDVNEYRILATRGWNQEGVAFNSYGTVPIYRLYHSGMKKHLYTKDKNEYDILANRGWKQEGIAFYAVK